MAADTSSFVAGHYTLTYNGVDVGTTEQGFEMRPRYSREDIKVDEMGDSLVDGIYRGYNITITASLSQWGASGRQAFQFPFDTVVGTLGKVDLVGQTMVGGGFAKQLVFTPVAGINTNNLTYTFPLVIPDGDHGGWNLNTRLRRVQINVIALVNRTTGVIFTQA